MLQQRGFLFARVVDFRETTAKVDTGILRLKLNMSNTQSLADFHLRLVQWASRMDPVQNRQGEANANWRKDLQVVQPGFDADYLPLPILGRPHPPWQWPIIPIVEFWEHHPTDHQEGMIVHNEIPIIGDCRCEICSLGGAYWEDPDIIPRTELGNALRVGSRVWNTIIQYE